MIDSPFLIQERMLAAHVRESYILEQQLIAEVWALRQSLSPLDPMPERAAE